MVHARGRRNVRALAAGAVSAWCIGLLARPPPTPFTVQAAEVESGAAAAAALAGPPGGRGAAEPAGGAERSRSWVDGLDAAEALQRGKGWLASAHESRDEREAAWAEMLLRRSVAIGEGTGDRTALASAYYHLAMAQQLLGKTREALALLLKTEQLRPHDPAIASRVGIVAEDAQQWDIAEDALRRWVAAAAAPEETAAAFTSLGWVLLRAGKTDDALRAFSNASRVAPHDPQVCGCGYVSMYVRMYVCMYVWM